MTLALRLVFGGGLLVIGSVCITAAESAVTSSLTASADNAELARLYEEDQADRRPAAGRQLDWSTVGPRDRAREARVKELYRANELKTGADYYHAAMVLQHGGVPEDYLLAHELCVVALSKGYTRALWLAAATEDRFLRSIQRPQRFGTQYLTSAAGVTELQETDESVTDEHRRTMNAPSLADAKARASRFDRGPKVDLSPAASAPALTQDIFTTTDSAGAALNKVQRFAAKTDEDLMRLQRACRDLSLRFPAAPIRSGAMQHAALHWARMTPSMIEQLNGWDPGAGERDPEFTLEQRASIAMRMATARATRRSFGGEGIFDELQFEEAAKAAANHHTTTAARDGLVGAALHIAPEVAIPRIREIVPESEELRRDIAMLEAVGRPFEFELKTLEGASIHLRDLRGKVVLLHFFAQRFSGSTAFVPKLKELADRHDAANLALIGINTDRDLSTAEKCVAETGITWPVHFDRGASGPGVSERFRARILPYYFLIDRAGILRYRGVQPASPQTLERIEALIAEPPPTGGS